MNHFQIQTRGAWSPVASLIFCLSSVVLVGCIQDSVDETESAGESVSTGPSEIGPLGGTSDGSRGGESGGMAVGACDDFYHQICTVDDDCEQEGYVCGPVVEECVSGRCECDSRTGEIVCTLDCIMLARLCIPLGESGASDQDDGSESAAGHSSEDDSNSAADAVGGSDAIGGDEGGAESTDLCRDWYYQTCTQDSDCNRDGYVCGALVEGCVSSVCGCDPATGEADICTADCGMGLGLCEPAVGDGSEDDSNAGGGVVGGSDAIGDDEGGAESTDLCRDWYYQTCTQDSDCNRDGYVCGALVEGCVSSVCGCDPATGEADICTADCGMGLGLCEPAVGDGSEDDSNAGEDVVGGPFVIGEDEGGVESTDLCDDWYYQTCTQDSDCERDGYVCGPIRDGCVSGICSCDPATGEAECTQDCGMGLGLCEPTGDGDDLISGGANVGGGVFVVSDVDEGGADGSENGGLCDDWYYRTCTQDSDCERDGYVCGPIIDGCVSGSCGCDPATGEAECTADCGMGLGLCEPTGDGDDLISGGANVGGGVFVVSDVDEGGADGSENGGLCDDWYYRTCTQDSDCERDGYVCGPIIDGCVSGSCGCDPVTGEAGICTLDCGMGLGLCEPAN